MQLYLKAGGILQGELSIAPLNLMLVFQVNCPGCLLTALPLLEKLNDKYPDLNCFAVSTAFEDFSLNTEKNTRLLLEDGMLTQDSARHFMRLGIKKLPYEVRVPVVMDWFIDDGIFTQLNLKALSLFDEESMSPALKQKISRHFKERIYTEYRCGRTFMNNDFQGTPSWVCFDDQMEIQIQWFGHKSEEWVTALLDKYHS